MREISSSLLSRSRHRGCLLGLAAGDALGTTLEFSRPGSFEKIMDMVGGGPFYLAPGEWTDDTSMALCLAESLIKKREFDPIDQLERYVRWYRKGYLSSTGFFFDIGGTTSAALRRFERTREPYPGDDDPFSAGNGSLMRLAPVPMFYARQPRLALVRGGDASRTTHASPRAVDACQYYTILIIGALRGQSKEELLAKPDDWNFIDSDSCKALCSLDAEIMEVVNGSYKHMQPSEIMGSGYVVRSMEAALWAFYNSTTFREGALLAANLGDDADTTAAIYGQLAGAYYGEEGIPIEWRTKLAMVDLIIDYSDKLFELAIRDA
jgi:ADP-ribosyl-[dinitrogen reductase] hydrolase